MTDAVSRILEATWPDTEDDRRAWFDRFGLTPATLIPGYDRWGTDIEHWGNATTCWGMSEQGFTGVSWFLWEDEPPESRGAERDALEMQLRTQLGEPSLREVPGHAGWWEWTHGDLIVELCAGGPRVRRTQVHVIHADRAEPVQATCDDDLEWETNPVALHALA